MKKLLLAGALAIAGMFSAQDKGLQGTWFATAQIGYEQTKGALLNGGKSTNTTILPIVGYFVAPTTAVGVDVGNVNIKAEDASGNTAANTNLLVVQPLVRKYYNVAGKLFFFGQLAAPIITGKEKESNTKVNSFSLAGSAGFDYIFSKHVTVEFSYRMIDYTHTTLKPESGEKTTMNSFNVAGVANTNTQYTSLLGASPTNILTPFSFGFKFIF